MTYRGHRHRRHLFAQKQASENNTVTAGKLDKH